MGPERLIFVARLAALALVPPLASCAGSGASAATPVADARALPRHFQVFHAMQAAERRALVDRLRERNPAPQDSQWTVNEEALVRSITVVDPFAGFLRRARRAPGVRAPRAGGALPEDEAATSARAFVKRNADLLGLPRHVVPTLAEHVRHVEAADHALPRAAWAVRFDAAFPTKGYERFDEVANHADLEVFVDDDGEVSSFVNLSRIHPHLAIDTKPALGEDDPRLVAKLVGRRVFALDPSGAGAADPRDLGRVPLGEVQAADVTRAELVIHAAPGPQLAWMAYRLAYFVEVAKPVPPEVAGDQADGPPQYFFFRYVVDADTGDVLEDARAPLSAPGAAAP